MMPAAYIEFNLPKCRSDKSAKTFSGLVANFEVSFRRCRHVSWRPTPDPTVSEPHAFQEPKDPEPRALATWLPRTPTRLGTENTKNARGACRTKRSGSGEVEGRGGKKEADHSPAPSSPAQRSPQSSPAIPGQPPAQPSTARYNCGPAPGPPIPRTKFLRKSCRSKLSLKTFVQNVIGTQALNNSISP